VRGGRGREIEKKESWSEREVRGREREEEIID
jgi:hypothetical protein